MKKSLSKSLTFLVAAIIVAQLNVTVLAEGLSTPPVQSNIIITNNSGIADTIKITNLKSGDIVNIYSDATNTATLGTASVSGISTEAIVSIPQLGISSGSVFVTVTSAPLIESTRIMQNYSAEPIAPKVENITIVNNALLKDTVTVKGLVEGDVIKVYNLETAGIVLGTSTVAATKVEATVSIPQISSDLGNVYVSITSKGKLESIKVKKAYDAEGETIAPEADSITILNKTGASDMVKVTGVKSGDVIKVYKDNTIITPLGKVIIAGTTTEATISIPQLGISEGSLFVTKANIGLKESTRTKKSYDAELVSADPIESNITIVNNALIKDTVKVTGLAEGDIVKVYNVETLGKALGTATVAKGKSEATVIISQTTTEAGKAYVSVTSKGKLESGRLEKAYAAEVDTVALTGSSIAVLNKTGSADTVKVSGVKSGDVIKAYKDNTIVTALGKVIVTGTGTASEVTLSIAQLGIDKGSVFVTITNIGLSESPRTEKGYDAEVVSTDPIESNITIVNNALIKDTVKVTGLAEGDIVKVYSVETLGKSLGTATVAKGKNEATVNIAQTTIEAGKVYVSVTSKAKLESKRVEKTYAAEVDTVALIDTSITVLNKTGSADTVKIAGVKVGDVIKVYKDNSIVTPLGKVIVTGTATEVTLSIAQLGIDKGSVFVTITNIGLSESPRTEKVYDAELVSTGPIDTNITIVNNALIKDTVKVAGLAEGDIVKVYNVETLGKALGTATVAKGKNEATVSISQTTTEAGKVYVSVTSKSKLESKRVTKTYLEESTTPTPDENKIVAINNIGKDLVLVYGLKAGDVVKVYSAATDGAVLGTMKVAVNQSYATLSITQLGALGGDIHISVTSLGLKESNRVTKSVEAE